MPETPPIPAEPLVPPPSSSEASVPVEVPEIVDTAVIVETPEASEISQVPEIAETPKEQTHMLDVHPAPHAATTWREFFIHLGTITIGLLIAIALDAGVEKLAHLHERHQLEAALYAECEHNKQSAENNFDVFDDRLAWLLGLRRDIDTMLATGGKANLPYRTLKNRPREASGEILMASAVWDTVKNNEQLALLPEGLARAYSVNYKQAEMTTDLRSIYTQTLARQAAFESRFADLETPGTPVLSRMNPQQLEEYAMLVSETFESVRVQRDRQVLFYGVNNATLKGLYDSPSRIREQGLAGREHPEDFKKLAALSAPSGGPVSSQAK
jgi:hypothetical protein